MTQNSLNNMSASDFSIDGNLSVNGNINVLKQPLFSASVRHSTGAVTGDATLYQIIFDEEAVDQTDSYNHETGEFTCPISGVYNLAAQVTVFGPDRLNLKYVGIFSDIATGDGDKGLSSSSYYTHTLTSSLNYFVNAVKGEKFTVKVAVGPMGGSKDTHVSGWGVGRAGQAFDLNNIYSQFAGFKLY